METNIEETEKTQPTAFESFKKHINKHKYKYLFGAGLALAAGVGYHIGNRGNSKHHYSRLLKDGVQAAVEDGMKNVVESGMKSIVKDGMRDVVEDVIDDAVINDIRRTVNDTVKKTTGETVRNVIKESAITIIKEVEKTVEPKQLVDSESDDMKKVIEYITKEMNGVKIRVDENGNLYKVKHTV